MTSSTQKRDVVVVSADWWFWWGVCHADEAEAGISIGAEFLQFFISPSLHKTTVWMHEKSQQHLEVPGKKHNLPISFAAASFAPVPDEPIF